MIRASLAFAVAASSVFAAPPATAQDYSNYVDLPETAWNLQEGPGVDLVEYYCTSCHSAAPIVQHPGFSRSGWLAEIEKMQTRYGAYVEDADAEALASYLTDNYGTVEESHWPADPTDVATD